MEYQACNVYHWGRGPADRLLAECLAPALDELRAAGPAPWSWFQRFDARGPHLFLLLGSDPGDAEALRARLGARLAGWMAAHPSTEPLSEAALRARHEQCRGKRLCALDGEPGMAPNNTLRWTAHPPDGYPLAFAAGVAEDEAFRRLLGELAAWSLGRLADGAGAALRWTAAVDVELRRAHGEAGGYWRHHAGTLLPGMEARLAADGEAVLAALPGVVGARNAAVFGRAWDAAEGGEPVWEGIPELLRIVLADDGRTAARRLRLLREVNHAVLAQLGQPVAVHVPLVLFAWMRGLAPAGAAG